MRRTISIALSFVGLLVGAGFATGQEVIQYFVSFGMPGLWGAVIAGVVFAIAGGVILGLGSYFLADEHNMVFRNISHPVMSKFLDISVTVTLFAIGFVMLAGAGSNFAQQFGWPTWVGAAIMTGIVMATGLLDVDKVSNIISSLTPLIIIAVLGVFFYTMFHLPSDTSQLSEIAQQADSPVKPWLLSALNYNGLALLLGVSMCLVIGGNHSDPRAALRGGLIGGIIYTCLLIMAAVVLYLNIADVVDDSVPMLSLYDSISPVLSFIMVWIIYAMIYNTAIGMFYALGRRLTSNNPKRYRPVFLSVCLVGFAISFLGFQTLMTYVYPAIGYVGIVMVAMLVWWGIKHRRTIAEEMDRRERILELTYAREHPDEEFTRSHARELEKHAEESNIHSEEIVATIEEEVATALVEDDSVDYTEEDMPESVQAAREEDSSRE